MVKLFRYTDKATGKECGISYSDKDGNGIVNPGWDCVEIEEKDKQQYLDLQKKNLDDLQVSIKKSDLEIRIEKLETDVATLKTK